jgi:uncharacterized phiE125 gp8 family phage protein
MPATLLAPPASEPLSLAEAKNFLRVEHDADDALIAALIAGARAAVEKTAHRVLITQTWRIVLDRWPPSGRVVVHIVPLRALVAARVLAADGAPAALDIAAFTLNTVAAPALIAFERASLPEPGRALAGIELDVSAGYGESAASVPAPLLHAIRLLLARAYEHRDRALDDRLPAEVSRLIAPYRVLGI